MRLLIGVLVLAGLVQDRPGVPAIPPEDFNRLHGMIRPQPGESPWRDIEWMTSIRGARERAAAEGKPVLVFTAADGSPLART
ncbi:MAG TPA: hypothetical protein VNM14_13830 [Planctomycetota bacterium]|jgi:hypothetical protein|nr:hypothetical protein [Planctomycetota bacterium]